MKRVYALYLLIFIFLLLFSSCHSDKYVQQELISEEFRANQESWFYDRPYYHILSKNFSIDSLPARIPQPKENQLTLYADFSKVWKEYILLYLINTTDDSVVLRNQDDDLYIKLEAEDKETGKWQRAQRHDYSTCGSSYGTTVLHSKSFLIYRGLYPKNNNGKITPVRYRMYQNKQANLISNIGSAPISQEMLDDVKFDLMSIENGDSTFITQVALGIIPIPIEQKYYYGPEYVRFRAIEKLADFTSDSTLNNLRRIVGDDRLSDYYRRAAIDALWKIKNDKSKDVLLWLLSDTTISPALYKEAFFALNTVSKADAMEFVRPICTNKNFPYRYQVLQELSNAYRLENEGERIESLRKKSWLYDSIKFMQEYKSTLENEIKRHRRLYPSHYKFFLLDTTLFQCINSQKYDLSDPSIKDLMICYAAYKTDDLVEYLKSINRTPNLPDSLKEHVLWLYEEHFVPNLPRLSLDFSKTKFKKGEPFLVPILWAITNNTNDTLNILLDTLIRYMEINIRLTEYYKNNNKQESKESEHKNVKLFLQDENDINFSDGKITIKPKQKFEFTLIFEIEKYLRLFPENQYRIYNITINGKWFYPGITAFPLRTGWNSTTLSVF